MSKPIPGLTLPKGEPWAEAVVLALSAVRRIQVWRAVEAIIGEEDVRAEATLEALRVFPDYDRTRAKLSTYIFRCLRNRGLLLISRLRRDLSLRYPGSRVSDWDIEELPDPRPEAWAEGADAEDLIAAAVDCLGRAGRSQLRAAVFLSRVTVGGERPIDVAEECGFTRTRMYQLRDRAVTSSRCGGREAYRTADRGPLRTGHTDPAHKRGDPCGHGQGDGHHPADAELPYEEVS